MTQEQRWLQTCQSFAQATPREWSANDERMYRLGLEAIAAVRAEEQAKREALVTALKEVADHPHNSYDHPSNSGHAREYGIGCADGHRCAASVARAALAGETK